MALAQGLLLSSMHCVMVLCVLRRLCLFFSMGTRHIRAGVFPKNTRFVPTGRSDNCQLFRNHPLLSVYANKGFGFEAVGRPTFYTAWIAPK